MKIGFVVNDVRTEEATYTTTRLAVAAIMIDRGWDWSKGGMVVASWIPVSR